MTPTERDPAFLWDMLTYGRQALEIVDGLSLDDYLSDRIRQLALERAVEIIGEAARQVSAEFQAAHLEIPWRPIIAQRHVLAHDYGEIDQEKIWRVATVHIPELVARLEPLIPPTT
jgi:uncharacterized protein with HEPN domain